MNNEHLLTNLLHHLSYLIVRVKQNLIAYTLININDCIAVIDLDKSYYYLTLDCKNKFCYINFVSIATKDEEKKKKKKKKKKN